MAMRAVTSVTGHRTTPTAGNAAGRLAGRRGDLGAGASIAALANDLAASDAAPVQSTEVFGFLLPRLAESGYPLIAAMLTEGVYADNPDGPDVEFGLTRILDGIERLIAEQA